MLSPGLRLRLAAASGITGLSLIATIPFAVPAGAAKPLLADYAVSGVARGVEIGFSFDNSLFPRLLDLGVPLARGSMTSQAGGEADVTASQLYPGDLIASQASGPPPEPFPPDARFPGIVQAHYPPASEKETDTVPFPPPIGPIQVATGRLHVKVSATRAIAEATTQHVVLGQAGSTPRISSGAVRTTSVASVGPHAVEQTVATVASDLRLVIDRSVQINIASFRSEATALSDGVTSTASAALHMSGVTATMNGTTHAARIDGDGVHLTGFPEGVPPGVPQRLDRELDASMNEAGISISTGTPVELEEGETGEASVGGLIIAARGMIPIVPVPDAVAQVVGMIQESLPPQVTDPICFQEDINPEFPLPLCLSPNVLPGPGTGSTTTLAFGNVHVIAGGAQEVVFPDEPPVDPGGSPIDEPRFGPVDGGFASEPPPDGTTVAPRDVVRPPQQAAVRGVISAVRSGPIALAGLVLSVLAVLIGLGPSLRQWRLPGSG